MLARYALSVTGAVDSLVITHMDALSHLKEWNYCLGYRDSHDLYDTSIEATNSADVLTSFHLPHFLSLDERAQFTQALSSVTPVFETCEADDEIVVRKIESLLETPVGMISRGPRAENVQLLNPLPS